MRHRHRTQKLPGTSIALIVAAIGALLLGYYSSKLINPTTLISDLKLDQATLYPSDFRTMPEFQLLDENGMAFTRSRFQGVWSLVFFGFTFCPDICPNTLSLLTDIKTSLAAKSDIQIVLITVDPERDTTEKLKSYVDYFDPSFVGVTGNPEEIKNVAHYFGVFYAKSSDSNNKGHYLVDHSAGLFLLNPEGKLFALFSPPHEAAAITRDLTKIYNHHEHTQ